ncbi:MAG: redox-sensing transcriptional repressor Rex [Clostridia bacterium]|nr:redox-sensing transcriptional repressor Rex [Clostridia bacterium]
MNAGLSRQALARLPLYLSYLKNLEEVEYISAPVLAASLNLNEVQVRKDLAAVSRRPGLPKKGFLLKDLIYDIADILGYHNEKDAILVGAGQLGRALMSYEGFAEYGIRIAAAFDTDPSVIDGKTIFPVSKMKDLCGRMKIHIGVITVPAAAAQQVCDGLIECGILAIWNFAPVHLHTPSSILVQNENMASSLALLSNHLRQLRELS